MIIEGTVVMIVGALDERVRSATGEPTYGTVIQVFDSMISVLLTGGDIWRGPARDVVEEVSNG